MSQIKLGLCGFTIAQHEYYETYSLLEVQQTFYDPPALSQLRRWKLAAPEEFEFTIKAWQVITHAGTSSTYRRMRMTMTAAQRAECGGFRLTPTVVEGWPRHCDAQRPCTRPRYSSSVLPASGQRMKTCSR